MSTVVNTRVQREQSLCVNSSLIWLSVLNWVRYFLYVDESQCVWEREGQNACVSATTECSLPLKISFVCVPLFIYIYACNHGVCVHSYWCWHQFLPQLASNRVLLLPSFSLSVCVCAWSQSLRAPSVVMQGIKLPWESEREMMSWDTNLKGQRENCSAQTDDGP